MRLKVSYSFRHLFNQSDFHGVLGKLAFIIKGIPEFDSSFI